jgi:hypothetical protein
MQSKRFIFLPMIISCQMYQELLPIFQLIIMLDTKPTVSINIFIN